jgi:drug/metabolite transporter (DMT)-like permease
MNMNKSNKGVILALITALLWGLLAVGLKVAVGKVDAFTIVWIRFVMAFSGLFVWFLVTDRKQLRILINPPWQLVVATLGLSINYIGFMLGVQYTSPSNAQVVIQIGPVLLALAGIFFFNEKVKRLQIVGFGVVVVGFVLFYNQQLKGMFFDSSDFNKGLLLTVMAAVTWAVYAIMQKKLVQKYPPQTLNLFLFGLPTLLYLPFANIPSLGTLSVNWWLLLVFLGANTLIAYGCMNASLKYIDANKVSAIIINNPIITFIIMAILTALNVDWIAPEKFTPLAWTGAIMFLAGAFLVVRAGKK